MLVDFGLAEYDPRTGEGVKGREEAVDLSWERKRLCRGNSSKGEGRRSGGGGGDACNVGTNRVFIGDRR